MLRLILGAAKGLAVGGLVGYPAYRLGLTGGWGYLVYGAIGLLVGFVVGRPFWSHLADRESTIWTSVLKGLVGAALCIGLFALVHAALGDPRLSLAGETRPLTDWSFLFGALLGAVYGAWVEADDPVKARPKADRA